MTGIFFGSTMGTTEAVAADIAKQLGVADADVHNVADTPAGEVQKYDLLVLGSRRGAQASCRTTGTAFWIS